MKIKTKIPINWTVQGKFNQTKNTIVFGELFELHGNILLQNKTFQYRYSSDEGEVILTGNKSFTKEEIDTLALLVENDIPSNLGYSDREVYLFYSGFILEFASTLGVDISDVEIVN